MATEIMTPISLPNEMNFQLPSSLPSAKNFEMRVQPVNAQSFTAGNVMQFDLPCGRSGQYLDTHTNYVRFKAVFTHAGTLGTDYSNLLGSAYSFFNKQEVYGNNSVLIESINEVGVLANMLFNCNLNGSDKTGLSPAMGFDYSVNPASNLGTLINFDATNALTFEFAIPLIGILGQNSDKFFPIGEIFGLRFELTMDNFNNFIVGKTASKVTSCVISEVEFVGQVIELSPEAQALISAANPQTINIRSQSYRTATNFLSAGSNGQNDVLCGIRVSSLKSMMIACSPSDAIEGKYASVNPNLGQGACLVIGGTNYPQRTLNPSSHPADCFMELQKCFGALGTAVFNGCINKSAYYSSSKSNGLCRAYSKTYANGLASANQFYLGLDVETVARKGSLLSGLNCNSTPIFLRCPIDTALEAVTHTLYMFGYYDCILSIDRTTKNIVAKW